MPESEARSFWARFSAYMEEHRGDLAGFAKQEGFASVHPSMKGGSAVLLVSRTSAQRPYAAVREAPGQSDAKERGRGGSSGHQGPPRDPSRVGGGRGKRPKRRT